MTDPREAIRQTMDSTSWQADAHLIIDTTAHRLAGDEPTDDQLEAIRAKLWPVWRQHFEASGAC